MKATPFAAVSAVKAAVLGSCMLACLGAVPAYADIIFSGSGTNAETGSRNQSAQADFSLSYDAQAKVQELTLTLTNTSGVTVSQGDALTGVLFNLSGNAVLSLQSMSLGSGANLWTSGSATNDGANLNGAWTDQLASSEPLAASDGVATTGFNGEFNGGSIGLGNSSPDYGILGADTLPGKLGGAKYPFAQDSLNFTMKVTSGSLSESDISGVRFMFGTAGTGLIPGAEVPPSGGGGGGGGGSTVPEPATFALLATALLAATAFAAKRPQDRRVPARSRIACGTAMDTV